MAKGNINDSDLNAQEIEQFQEYADRAVKGVLKKRSKPGVQEPRVSVDAGVVGNWAHYHIAENLQIASINWKNRVEKKVKDLQGELSKTDQHKDYLTDQEKRELKATLSTLISNVQEAIAKLST